MTDPNAAALSSAAALLGRLEANLGRRAASPAALDALEAGLAGAPWDTPPEREQAQRLLLRLSRLRAATLPVAAP